MTNTTDQIVLIVAFDPMPGRKEAFREHLFALVRAMSKEPHFVNTIVHDDLNHADRLVLYEIWSGTRERWLRRSRRNPTAKPMKRACRGCSPTASCNGWCLWPSGAAA